MLMISILFSFFFHCGHRYRFLELYYRRAETTHKSGRVVPSRVETVILFLPDVWSCVPTKLEWDGLHISYKKQLDRKLTRSSSTNSEDVDAVVAADDDAAAVIDQKALPTTIPLLLSIFFFHISININIITHKKKNQTKKHYLFLVLVYISLLPIWFLLLIYFFFLLFFLLHIYFCSSGLSVNGKL